MKSFLSAAAIALATVPSLASATPMFLPDLTFPEPVSQPEISSQGCTATGTATCQ